MPRSIWNGTITFGLMRVPVEVHSATADKSVHFHEVHAKEGAQIEHRRICSNEERAVPYNQVAKGYEVRKDEYVLLDQDEIDAAAGRRSRDIELEEFVAAGEIDPVHYARGYYLGPAPTAGRPTGCCTMRWSGRSASAWDGGCFTTASTLWRCGHSTPSWGCTRSGSPTSWWR